MGLPESGRAVGTTALPRPPAPSVPKLGVGLGYQPELRSFMERRPDEFDFLEVVPEVVWNDLGPGHPSRYVPDAEASAFLEAQSHERYVIPHSMGLSIGSAHRFDREHVEQMKRWHEWLRFPWHSDHLAFHLAELDGEANANLTLPIALDREALQMVAGRAAEVRRTVPTPFLLENNASYFRLEQQDFEEVDFLNALTRGSGCGLLLDLHNLYVNSRNLGLDWRTFLDRLDMDAVVEVHLAGGMEMDGFYLDAHSGPTPEPVWWMLEAVLPQCANLGGVTFELFGSWYEPMGEDALRRQLARVRKLWSRHKPEPVRRVA